MCAADEIGCTPWDLEQQPIFWRERALIKRAAEAKSKRMRQNYQEQMETSRRELKK